METGQQLFNCPSCGGACGVSPERIPRCPACGAWIRLGEDGTPKMLSVQTKDGEVLAACPACDATFKLKERSRGRKYRCPKCRFRMRHLGDGALVGLSARPRIPSSVALGEKLERELAEAAEVTEASSRRTERLVRRFPPAVVALLPGFVRIIMRNFRLRHHPVVARKTEEFERLGPWELKKVAEGEDADAALARFILARNDPFRPLFAFVVSLLLAALLLVVAILVLGR